MLHFILAHRHGIDHLEQLNQGNGSVGFILNSPVLSDEQDSEGLIIRSCNVSDLMIVAKMKMQQIAV
jgi:hypothetical protein